MRGSNHSLNSWWTQDKTRVCLSICLALSSSRVTQRALICFESRNYQGNHFCLEFRYSPSNQVPTFYSGKPTAYVSDFWQVKKIGLKEEYFKHCYRPWAGAINRLFYVKSDQEKLVDKNQSHFHFTRHSTVFQYLVHNTSFLERSPYYTCLAFYNQPNSIKIKESTTRLKVLPFRFIILLRFLEK